MLLRSDARRDSVRCGSVRYLVVIPYVEPTYRPSDSGERAPYTASFEVCADSKREAIEVAMRRFDGDASDSGVGWIREVLEHLIEVTTLSAEVRRRA